MTPPVGKNIVSFAEDFARIQQENTRLRGALSKIAMQEKSDEREDEGDLAGGFDALVDIAREAIQR